MKVKIEVECTPAEARAFLGLPDVTAVNEDLVAEMRSRLESGLAALQPDELVKTWSAYGGLAQDQFRKLMTAAAEAALSRSTTRP